MIDMSEYNLSEVAIPKAVRPIRPRRSVLYVPANNERALQKSLKLDCDAIIYDLEDAVLPEHKIVARESLHNFLKSNFPDGVSTSSKEIIIRMNSLASEWGADDLIAIRAMMPSAVLVPKVSETDDVIEINDALVEMDTPHELRLWAMIETARGILNVSALARYARTPGTRLDCFVAGINDLVKETGVAPVAGRPYLSNWLSQIVLAARAYGLDVIDGVYNDFRDLAGYQVECFDGNAMGFDGKSLIHPDQIKYANDVFGISAEVFEDAQAVISAFEKPENHQAGVIQIDGRMVERLHLEIAEKLVHKAQMIKDLET